MNVMQVKIAEIEREIARTQKNKGTKSSIHDFKNIFLHLQLFPQALLL